MDALQPEFDQQDCRLEVSWTHLTPLHEVLENEDLRAQVNKAIDALPDTYRIVLQLRDVEGYDTGEVAGLLEISDQRTLEIAEAVLAPPDAPVPDDVPEDLIKAILAAREN